MPGLWAGLACVAVALCVGMITRNGRGLAVPVRPRPRIRLPGPLRSFEEAAARSRARGRAMRQMPEMLDIVTLGLTAGLSFDASLELYCSRFGTELARELWVTMLDWRLGLSTRAEALQGLARRLDSVTLRRFADVVTEALEFGSPLAATLERQASMLRDEQRSHVEEEIERTPVKMLIPLGTLIVPALLLSILGPLLSSALKMT